MTVMVTGASGVVGRALVQRLVRRDEVRACVRDPDAAERIRALGAKVAVGRLDDVGALAEVLRRVYTLIHLVGGPNQADDDATLAANHGSVVTALAAAREAGVERFLLLSVPGAATDAAHPFLRAKGLAEEAVAHSGLEHAIVRATHVYGPGGLWFTSTVEGAITSPPFVVGDGRQSIAPVFVDDVAAVLAAADDADHMVSGTWAIEGPDALTAAALVARLAPDGPAPLPLEPAAAAALLSEGLGAPVSVSAATFFAMPSRADAPNAAEAFGVARTSLAEGLAVTVERAAASRTVG
jgi:uncharacterized protein YbjT (DUF2867 family)